MFTEEQISALTADLNKSHVRQREQAGRKLSYIEGWHAIAEANRIFGFDAWERETVELHCVSQTARKVGKGQYQRDGHGCTYLARVRVRVRAGDHWIVREGCGAGHGIDADAGLAHESAIKEAETDAMKRALMTFGNPFGLALYDKDQRNVSDGAQEPEARPEPKPAAKPAAPKPDPQARERAERIKQAIDDSLDVSEVNRTLLAYATDLESLPAKTREWLEDRAEKRRHTLAQAPGKEKAA